MIVWGVSKVASNCSVVALATPFATSETSWRSVPAPESAVEVTAAREGRARASTTQPSTAPAKVNLAGQETGMSHADNIPETLRGIGRSAPVKQQKASGTADAETIVARTNFARRLEP